MSQALRDEQEIMNRVAKPLVVVLDVVTRWNSTLAMLERLVELRQYLESMAFSASRGTLENLDAASQAKIAEHRLTSDDWLKFEAMIMILRPFDKMTLIFSGSSSGIAACVAPWVKDTLYLMETRCPKNEDVFKAVEKCEHLASFRNSLLDQLKDRVMYTDDHLVASVLHPNFNNLWFLDDEAEETLVRIKERIRTEYMEANSISDQPSTSPALREDRVDDGDSSGMDNLLKRRRVLDKAKGRKVAGGDVAEQEMSRYFAISVEKEVDPHVWWLKNWRIYPGLSTLSRRYLAIPASSVASERVFSYSGNVITDKRSRLADDTVSDIVFCNYAMKCIEVAKISERENA